ncbi:MAG: hypothetical protein DRN81_02945 [Thermoproteota archaeon]|nr:MAG: hypothetical protein DRN81_02945 [Candidatus Korarchaeota archaeon]
MRYRLIKPKWAYNTVDGPNVFEGEFSKSFLKARNTDGYNIYYFPNHNSTEISGQFLKGREVDVFKYIFVDMDLKDGIYTKGSFITEVLDNFPLTPHSIVDSGHGIHIYWEIKDLNRNDYIALQLRLIQRFKTDQSIWTALQLMRTPGFYNTKNQEKQILAEETRLQPGRLYTVDDFDEALPELTKENYNKALTHINSLSHTSEKVDTGMDVDALPDSFLRLMEEDDRVVSLFLKPKKGKRSEQDYALANILWEENFDRNTAINIMANTEKAMEKGNSRMEYVYLTVDKAYFNRDPYKFRTVADYMETGDHEDRGELIHGPSYFDSTVHGWRKSQVLGMIAGSGAGKCLGVDTPVILYDGTVKKVQDVNVGDQLMGDDSTPRNVLSLARGRERLYKITSIKGETYTVNSSHILSLKCRQSNVYSGYAKGDILNIAIEDYIKKPMKFKQTFKGYRTSIEFPPRDVPINPYFLGIWLGDGHSDELTVTTMDKEVKRALLQTADEFGLKLKFKQQCGKAVSYHLSSGPKTSIKNRLWQIMQDLDLRRNKHIPLSYKTNSEEVRLQILAGLLDSDGHLSHNCFSITQKRKVLADDIVYLARSLGFAATIRKRMSKCNGKIRGPYYVVYISGDTSRIPTRLPRKMATPRKQIRDVLVYSFTVKELESGDYYGFTLDGNKLFLLGDFTVTHNTTATLDLFYETIKNNPNSTDIYIFFTLEMPEWEIVERWKALTGGSPELAKRLYVIGNEDENGDSRHINLQKIYWYSENIMKVSGKKVAMVAIDHIGIVDLSVDTSKKPTFNFKGRDSGFGFVREMPFEFLCAQIKTVAKELDCFVIVQSQTTKERAGDGDTELGINAAYGSAKFEWFVDYILTFWQPIRRVEHKTDLRVMGWQYCKIRKKGKMDTIKTYEKYALGVDIDSGKLSELTDDEFRDFVELLKDAHVLRKQSEKKEGAHYTKTVKKKTALRKKDDA